MKQSLGTTSTQASTTHAHRRRRRSSARARTVNYLGLGFLVFLLAIWELADRVGLIHLTFLPRPSAIGAAAVQLVAQNEFFPNVAHTLTVTLIGWAIACASGLIIGVVLGLFRPVWTYSMSTVELFRALPSIVLLPLSVLLLGFSVEMELVLVIFSAQWPVMISTIDGIRQVPRGLQDAGKTLRLSRWDVVRKIMLPSALPQIFVGLRLALALSLILAIAAEMLGNPSGMGNALVSEQEALRPDAMFVYFLSIGILGVILNTVFVFFANLATPGHHARSERSAR